MLYDNYKHSASAGNLFLDSMSAFLWRYGFKQWGKDNPRINMGKAAEQAVYAALANGGTPAQAKEAAINIFDSMHQGEVYEEREAAGLIAANMLTTLLSLGGKFERRPREARSVTGLNRKVSFEADLYHSERGIIDLKATMRMPWGEKADPKPHWSHVRQQGLYRNLENGTPVNLLYATPKRCELYAVPDKDAERGAYELLTAFEQIERWADQFPTPEQAVRFIPLNTDTFYWDDPEAVTAANQLWRENARRAA